MQLEEAAAQDFTAGATGTLHSSKLVRSGRDTVGDAIRQYIAWPQEHVFIGPTRKRVKYDELTQT